MAEEALGTVVGLWRYPVKSMMGEELNAATFTERGLFGDRAFALLDPATGKVVSAKNPRRWGRMFDFRASFAAPPQPGSPLPPVRITLPDGTDLRSDHDDIGMAASQARRHSASAGSSSDGLKVTKAAAPTSRSARTAARSWPS